MKLKRFFIRETQISEAERTEICKSNNPDEVGGYNRLGRAPLRSGSPQLFCGISFQSLLWGFKPVISGVVLFSVMLLVVSCKNNDEESDAFGNFEAEEVIVSAQVQGELLSFDMNEGIQVEEGKTVGIIDTTSLILQKKQLLAQKKLLNAKRESIGSQIEVQLEQLKNLQRERDRIKNLVAGNAATSQQFEDINGNVNVVESQIRSVKTQFESVEAENSVLQAQIEQVMNQLAKCKIVNPVNGIVLEKYIQAHELVNPGKSLYKIADISELELKVYVSGNQLSQIKLGDSVQVFIDRNKDELQSIPGKISWVSNEAEFTPKIIQTREERVNMVYAVKIKVKNDGSLKIGMPGEIKFNTKKE